mmetsp:Transcript_14373/g.20350  ORF Transcript_14373/g.20350 Transcript_14373/m.20350 type:complete len:293 (+) Transcript_14373:67-945(+)
MLHRGIKVIKINHLANPSLRNITCIPQLEHVKFEMDKEIKGLGIVRFNRPESRDALSPEMADSLVKLSNFLNESRPSDMRCIILTGSSEKSFSSGRDLKLSSQHDTEEKRYDYLMKCNDGVEAINDIKVPTIACITGAAFGWGVEVALACDIRVASDEATLCLPEASLAIFPGAGGTVRMPRIVGPAVAKYIIYTSKRFNGKEAKELGVVNYSEESAIMAMQKAKSIAKMICDNGPLGCRAAKTVINDQTDISLKEALSLSLERRIPLSHTNDFKKAVEAFKNRSKPSFNGD